MALWNRVWNLVRGDRHRDELDEELAFHVEMRKHENLASGMSGDEATQDARRRFGNITLHRERTRDAGIFVWLDSLMQDIRYAFRGIRNSRSVAALIIAALALGVGANTGIFTITNALILRSLPIKDPVHLMNVGVGNFMSWGYIEGNETFTYAQWKEFLRRQDVLDGAFAYGDHRFDVVLHGETRRVVGAFATTPAFQTLGVEPVIGRAFTATDERNALTAPVVMIGYGLWERDFASDPDVIGQPLTIEGKSFTIIGVTPPRFFGLTVGLVADLYMPLATEPYMRAADSALLNDMRYFLRAFGRLRQGISPEVAQARLTSVARMAMAATVPAELPEHARPDYLRQTFTLSPAPAGVSEARGELGRPLAVLSAIAAVLLLLACFTVANLLLARATARRKEIAVRVSLGASRGRIVRQVMVENLVLAAAGAVAGIIVARFTSRYLVDAYMTQSYPLRLDISLDWRVFGFALGIAVVSAVVFGIAPAIRAAQVAPAETLKGAIGPGSSVLRLRAFLLAAQISLAVILVSGAILFGATLRNLLTADRGFHSEGVVVAEIDLRRLNLAKDARAEFYLRLSERMHRVPGIDSASLSYVIPLSGGGWQFNVNALTPSGPKDVHIHFNGVTQDFFRTFGTTVIAGRGFSGQDRYGSPSVVLVNPAFAERAFGTVNVVGQRLSYKDPEPRIAEIVGVVQNAKYRNLRDPVPPTIYAPMAQFTDIPPFMGIALRARGPVAPVTRDLRRILSTEYPDLSFTVSTLETQLRDSVARERMFAYLCWMFGMLALTLAAIGIYGVLSYMVARRRPEIGIRLALGATPRQVRRIVYSQSFVTCAVGAIVGCLVAVGGARFVAALLYGVTPGQLWVYAAVMLILAGVAAVATIVPAARASRTEPMQVLRCE